MRVGLPVGNVVGTPVGGMVGVVVGCCVNMYDTKGREQVNTLVSCHEDRC